MLGILGGGQLGKMIALSAHNLGVKSIVYSDTHDSPAVHVTPYSIIAPYTDYNSLKKFADSSTVVTCEFENIPSECLNFLSRNVELIPGKFCFEVASNRVNEKKLFNSISLPTTPWKKVTQISELSSFIEEVGLPLITKNISLGYDGKGQKIVKTSEDIHSIQYPCIAEKFIDFSKEISVVISKDKNDNIEFFPISDNLHQNGILVRSSAPSSVSQQHQDAAKEFCGRIADKIGLIGIMCTEFFITQNNEILINEIAPRPHNSCHWSINACNLSQFDQLVRIAIGLQPKPVIIYSQCATENILGSQVNDVMKNHDGINNSVFIYGKKETKRDRKMGHINIVRINK